jgi:hypothetical protein
MQYVLFSSFINVLSDLQLLNYVRYFLMLIYLLTNSNVYKVQIKIIKMRILFYLMALLSDVHVIKLCALFL